MLSSPSSQTLRVAIIGAGPRGTSVLERLISQLSARSTGQPLAVSIHLVDPFPAGPGRVWRTEQSELYLMNTQSFFPTVVPDQGVEAVSITGLTFNDWRARFAPELGREEFPPRAVYGRYLRWTFERLLNSLPPEVSVQWHQSEAESIEKNAEGGYSIRLSDADSSALEADAVVLALGHLPANLSAEQSEFAEAARSEGLGYWPPAIPADVDWSQVSAGENVLVRGMGLNFFDLLVQWTQGRGGRFEATGDGAGRALRYWPSGQEPKILAASRRGTPYRAKAELKSYYPAAVELRFLTEQLAQQSQQLPGFEHDLWPALHKDVLWAYYTTLLGGTSEELATALQQPDWQLACQAFESGIPVSQRLALESLAKPFAGRRFASHREFDAAVLNELERDAQGSAAGESDPVKMAIGALNKGRALIKGFVLDGGITEASWLAELRGWFEPLVEGLASGPPAVRIEQLAALARAGVVRFIGPDPRFSVDQEGFLARSPWVQGAPWRAKQLVEAMSPANRVLQSSSPLLQRLLADGLARPKAMLASDGDVVLTSGLDVSEPPYRLLDASGTVVDDLYLLGLQLSSTQWGTAIAAEAQAQYPSGYQTLVDADRIASDILRTPR
ncbi:FAD/NAD(P)-binding protein [Psychromicrobium sp. YIM B11713]|uniref:FAD/NAD(P)-binding protein n=1 Tax=Psychromicrobium sp. YIM B11713 TaxID=3145233 RepID=UPI00374F36D6